MHEQADEAQSRDFGAKAGPALLKQATCGASQQRQARRIIDAQAPALQLCGHPPRQIAVWGDKGGLGLGVFDGLP